MGFTLHFWILHRNKCSFNSLGFRLWTVAIMRVRVRVRVRPLLRGLCCDCAPFPEILPGKLYKMFWLLHDIGTSSFLMCENIWQYSDSQPSLGINLKENYGLHAACAFLSPGVTWSFVTRVQPLFTKGSDATHMTTPPHSRPSWSTWLSAILQTKFLFMPFWIVQQCPT